MRIKLSPHQKAGHCKLCDDDATKNNHCSWCGLTFEQLEHLVDHLDHSDCSAQIAQAFGLPKENQ